ncbi:MAG: hypothetical protein IKJ27_05535 [Clostridia bacterium]|nr:hypothetical protein [Clostridia bacterium]
MTCPRCGNIMNEGARFCDSCGFAVNEENTKVQSSVQQPEAQYNPYAQQNPYAQPQQNPYAQPQQNFNQPPYGYAQQPYGQPNYNPYGFCTPPVVDKPDTAINVISFFVPLVGLIMYLVERDTKPVKAKAALKWSLISWGVSAVLVILYFVFVFCMIFFA